MTQHLLADQQAALSNFLDELLTEDEVENLSSDEVEASVNVQASATDPSPPSNPDVGNETDSESDTESLDAQDVSSPPAETEEEALFDAADADMVLEQVMSADDGRVPILPEWGIQPFQAMVFKLGALSLAIPMNALAGVIEWKQGQLDTSASKGLYLGLYPHMDRQIRVVDTAQLVFADSAFDVSSGDAEQRLSRIILMNNEDLGLAVDSVHEVITIQPTRVNWRSVRTRRQWLAGTMLDDMIVVLDAQSATKIITDMLHRAE